MKKAQIFTVFLVTALCVICLGLIPIQAHAETLSSGIFGDDLSWVLDDSGTLTISGTGDFPASSAAKYAPWYSQQKQITTVIIDTGITSLPDSAFKGYESLTKFIMSDTVTSVGSSILEDCRKLNEVKLSNNLTVLPDDTFRLCYGLTELTIPKGVTTIGSLAFYDCHNLISIAIPGTVTYVDRGAFTSCNRLTNIYIDDIAAWMNLEFSPQSSHRILDVNKHNKTLYLNNKPVTALVIPNGIQEIAPSTFYGCDFASVTIPDSVTSIGNDAFSHCRSLEKVVISNQVTQIGEFAFFNCEKLTSATIGENVTSIGSGAFWGCKQLKQIAIPNRVTKIGTYIFADCAALTHVTIGTGIPQISDYMFSGCTSLPSLSIPRNIQTIGQYAFTGCANLAHITIAEGLTSISEYAFWECSGLTGITLPNSLTVIGKCAFSKCSALKNVVCGTGLRVIEPQAFEICDSLVNVEFQDGLTTIGERAFYRCPDYQMVILPASVESVGINSFYAPWHVLFKGTESQWNSFYFKQMISGAITSDAIHFECTGNELPFTVIAPTCTSHGYTAYTCSRCNEIRHNQLTDATGHSYGAWYIAEEATFTNPGTERRDCKHCGNYETKKIPVKTHTDKNNDFICDDCGSNYCTDHIEQLLPGNSATCEQDGFTDGTICANCNATLQAQDKIPASGHSYGEWTQITTPTGEEIKERVCAHCDKKEQQQVVVSVPTDTVPLASPEPTTPSPATQPGADPTEPITPSKEDPPAKTDPIVIILIVTAAVVIAGGAAFVLIKKRK